MRYTQDNEIYITGFDKDSEKQLVARGVPPQDLPTKRVKIDIEKTLVRIEPQITGVPLRTISPAKQYKVLCSVLDHPLRSAYTIGISSFPSDARAKHLAITIMHRAILAYKSATRRRNGLALPLWHRVYGGFNDVLRDKQVDTPCMLIISNIGVESTPSKIEKVRDILEKFSNIPRIVVMGGDPPCNLFANKLHFPMKAGFYLGPDNYVRTREIQ